MTHIEEVQNLERLARAALKVKESADVVQLTEALEHYLDALELWQKNIQANNPLTGEGGTALSGDREALKAAIQSLQALHQELMSSAEEAKGFVGSQMTDVHKRAQGLRKYIDIYPASISMGRKKKG